MSEFAFIERIRARAAHSRIQSADLKLGIGDDTAIFQPRAGRELLLTTDLLVEDVDFKLEYAVPRWLGHKVLTVSLSDIAAMGGTPRYSLLTLAIPPALLGAPPLESSWADSFWEAFFDGYFAVAERAGVVLIGGDISSTPHGLAFDSLVVGDCESGRAVRRSGAQAGDGVYVTGSVGASAAGLKLLLAGARVHEAEQTLAQQALRAHLRPEARVEFGQRLGASGLAHSLIDVSDGLAQDLAHLCVESRVSAVLDFDAVPLAETVSLIAVERAEQFQFAVNGGEDYELLFTASAENEAALWQLAQTCGVPLTRVGEIGAPAQTGPVFLRKAGETAPLSFCGYDHFAV
jgi:thiamine-monophosphate kinase